MNQAIKAYLAQLAARRFFQSRRQQAARTLERLLIYMREAHSLTDWRAVHESQLRDFARYVATRHRYRGAKESQRPRCASGFRSCARSSFG